MKNKKAQSDILLTFLIILLVIAAIVIMWTVIGGLFYDFAKDEKSAERYVKEIYPEYTNCSMDYSCGLTDCPTINCRTYCGVRIYCDNKTYDDRDSLRIGRPAQAIPTLQIEFKNITIEEIKQYYKVRDGK